MSFSVETTTVEDANGIHRHRNVKRDVTEKQWREIRDAGRKLRSMGMADKVGGDFQNCQWLPPDVFDRLVTFASIRHCDLQDFVTALLCYCNVKSPSDPAPVIKHVKKDHYISSVHRSKTSRKSGNGHVTGQ